MPERNKDVAIEGRQQLSFAFTACMAHTTQEDARKASCVRHQELGKCHSKASIYKSAS